MKLEPVNKLSFSIDDKNRQCAMYGKARTIIIILAVHLLEQWL